MHIFIKSLPLWFDNRTKPYCDTDSFTIYHATLETSLNQQRPANQLRRVGFEIELQSSIGSRLHPTFWSTVISPSLQFLLKYFPWIQSWIIWQKCDSETERKRKKNVTHLVNTISTCWNLVATLTVQISGEFYSLLWKEKYQICCHMTTIKWYVERLMPSCGRL